MVEELQARLGQNSSNSNRPPSSDSPSDRRERPHKQPSGRRRGAQPGHKPLRRELLPPEQVTDVQDVLPPSCRRCGRRLPRRLEAEPLRHQVVDLPEIRPDVHEWRLHRVACECGAVTCAELPTGVPRGMLGARALGLIGLLTGVRRVSRREAVALLGDVLHVKVSLGTLSQGEGYLSESVAAPVAEAHAHVIEQAIKHVDATTWQQRGQPRTLWTIATTLATVFFVSVDATQKQLRALFQSIRGTLVSDRGRQFTFWAMHKRQICWAHLIRKFASFAERAGEAGRIGDRLLLLSRVVLRCWHNVRDGTMSRRQFREFIDAVSPLIEGWLEAAVRLRVRGVSGSCADILRHREALWTFARQPGVEPTNNHAERELRPIVLWRKQSFGSQSERGDRFAERMMTVSRTLRKQGRNVLEYLTAACQAHLRGEPAPSLLFAGQ